MINFNLEKAPIWSAMIWKKTLLGLNYLQTALLAFSLVGLFLYFYLENPAWVGIALIAWPGWLTLVVLKAFYHSSVKTFLPKITPGEALAQPLEINLAQLFSLEAASAISRAEKHSRSARRDPTPTPLLYFLLKEAVELSWIFSRLGLDSKKLTSILEKNLLSSFPAFEPDEMILGALRVAERRNHSLVQAGDLLIWLAGVEPTLKKILLEADLTSEEVENVVRWQEELKKQQEKSKRFWDYESLARLGTLASDWAAGYTLTLDQYGIDWTEIVNKRDFEEIVGRDKEIAQLEQALARETKAHALLIGEPGIGKRSIVYALAKKVLSGTSLSNLNYKRMVELDVSSLLAAAPSLESAEALLETIFAEAVSAGNIILVIDNLSELVRGERRPGIVDISGVLFKYLQIPTFQVIGITTRSGFHLYLEPNPGLINQFAQIEVVEISAKATLIVLQNRVPLYEKKYPKFISYPVLKEIVNFSEKYLPQQPFPQKALDLLEEVLVYSFRYLKASAISRSEVAHIVSEKTKIPVGEIQGQEKQVLLNLEELIHQRIINQDHAVREISNALRRGRAGITIRQGPIGVFLFLGPTGVGKTETAKALAEIYFGSEEVMIRLDMSEFQEIKDIARLIGGPEQKGLLTSRVRERPFSLILLDELEKAHPDLLNLFLQVFDEGYLTDGWGRKTSFKNAIIIATSNAGYQVILRALQEKREWGSVRKELLDYLFREGIFRPEFINRFDDVIVFSPLTKENLLEIAQLMLERLQKNLAQKQIEFVITPALKQKMVELGYDEVFGGRAMRRVIQDKVENAIAQALLAGQIQRGDRIKIDPIDFRVIKS